MDPLVHTRDQSTVETVDFSRRTCSEESEDRPIGRKGDGHRFLGFARCDSNRLSGQGQNVHRAQLRWIIGPSRRRIEQKTAPFGEEKVLFHHDNAPAHTSAVARAKIVELGYELLPHQPYSPDLAPCDYFLFPQLKYSLRGRKFGSNEEFIAATETYYADLEQKHFLNGLKKLEHRFYN